MSAEEIERDLEMLKAARETEDFLDELEMRVAARKAREAAAAAMTDAEKIQTSGCTCGATWPGAIRGRHHSTTCNVLTCSIITGSPAGRFRCLELRDHRGPHWKNAERIDCDHDFICPGHPPKERA